MRILVIGGVRSGKSAHAEGMLRAAPGVMYVAPGRPADGSDPGWDARVAQHKSRRPSSWATVETTDLPEALVNSPGPVLIDCLGTWLVALMDDGQLWNAPPAQSRAAVDRHLDALCDALTGMPDVVVVTNEVGLGVVPAHRSGVVFRDLLGIVNQRVAAVSEEVHLVIAGRVLRL